MDETLKWEMKQDFLNNKDFDESSRFTFSESNLPLARKGESLHLKVKCRTCDVTCGTLDAQWMMAIISGHSDKPERQRNVLISFLL